MRPLSVVITEKYGCSPRCFCQGWQLVKMCCYFSESAKSILKLKLKAHFLQGVGIGVGVEQVEAQQALLLIMMGAGLYGWLPGLCFASISGRPCHLIWCVKSEGDYHALKDQLPCVVHIGVTIYITRSENDKYVNLSRNAPEHIKKRIEQTSENRLYRGAFCLLFTPLAATLRVVSWFWLLYARSENHLHGELDDRVY